MTEAIRNWTGNCNRNRMENKACIEVDLHKWKVFICKVLRWVWCRAGAWMRKNNSRLFTANGDEKFNLRYREQRSFYTHAHCYICVSHKLSHLKPFGKNVTENKIFINKWIKNGTCENDETALCSSMLCKIYTLRLDVRCDSRRCEVWKVCVKFVQIWVKEIKTTIKNCGKLGAFGWKTQNSVVQKTNECHPTKTSTITTLTHIYWDEMK